MGGQVLLLVFITYSQTHSNYELLRYHIAKAWLPFMQPRRLKEIEVDGGGGGGGGGALSAI